MSQRSYSTRSNSNTSEQNVADESSTPSKSAEGESKYTLRTRSRSHKIDSEFANLDYVDFDEVDAPTELQVSHFIFMNSYVNSCASVISFGIITMFQYNDRLPFIVRTKTPLIK